MLSFLKKTEVGVTLHIHGNEFYKYQLRKLETES